YRLKALADQVQERAAKGEDFAKLAQKYSEADSGPAGGDIGFERKDQLEASLAKTLFALPAGGVSPVETVSSGYLILKVTAAHHAGQETLDEASNEISNILYQQLMQPEMKFTSPSSAKTLTSRSSPDTWTAAPAPAPRWTSPISSACSPATCPSPPTRTRRAAASTSAAAESNGDLRMPENLKTVYVSDLVCDTTITSVFLVAGKDVRQKKDGDPYLSLLLGDRTGQIEAKMWDGVEEVQSTFERDDFVRVRAQVVSYREKPQLKIERLRMVAESEVALGDYLPATTADVAAMWSELEARIAACTNPHLK